MKHYLVLTLTVFSLSCVGQKSDHIYYELPESVNGKVAEYIKDLSAKNKAIEFAAKLFEGENQRYVLTLVEFDKDKLEKDDLVYTFLVKKTNRFLRLHDLEIPLYLHLDLQFADFGKEVLPNGKVARTKVLQFTHGFNITFDSNGNIYED